MDVAVDRRAATKVRLECEGAHPVALDQHLKHVELELLKLAVAMRRLTEGHHARALGYLEVRDPKPP